MLLRLDPLRASSSCDKVLRAKVTLYLWAGGLCLRGCYQPALLCQPSLHPGKAAPPLVTAAAVTAAGQPCPREHPEGRGHKLPYRTSRADLWKALKHFGALPWPQERFRADLPSLPRRLPAGFEVAPGI